MSATDKAAQQIARLLDNDPILASKLKEHIPPSRLCELLDLRPLTSEVEDAAREDLVEEVVKQVPLHELLEAYNQRGNLITGVKA